MMTVAGTGAGKGRSAIIPNLLTYPGSVYCQDFKGQNAAVTAQRRRTMGQTVHILDPMGAVLEKGARLNPLEPLDPKARGYVEQIDSIVDALVIGSDDKNRFFEDAARTLIAGLIDYVVRRDGDGEFEPPADDDAMEDIDVEE
jgi:type IV secretion system protein VirD4